MRYRQMNKNTLAQSDSDGQPRRLTVSVEVARSKIRRQIEEGQALVDSVVQSEQDFDRLKEESTIWYNYTRELLSTLFTTAELANEFTSALGGAYSMRPTFEQRVGYKKDFVRKHLVRLKSIDKKLELYPVGVQTPEPCVGHTMAAIGRKVFIVHGRDDGTKETVARFMQKLELEAVILHEQSNKGKTIIEKFEHYADVSFAVVLLTPDDIGAEKHKSGNLKPRARQNVVLEHGYFLGKLGRDRVAALYRGTVELPSDLDGVLYIPMDSGEDWRLKLASEIKSAGISVDLNRVI